jgi:O-antigen/teichoic acid export membrane protein
VVLVPIFGLTGAAIATTISALTLLIATGYALISRIGFDIDLFTVLRLLFLSLLVIAAAQLPLFATMSMPFEFVSLYALFTFGLFVTKGVRREDFTVIKGIVQFRPT